MKRFLLPAVALAFSTLPLASGSASANVAVSPAGLMAVGEHTMAATNVHWRGHGHRHWGHYGWHGHRYGHWRGPHWHRYGYHRRYWRG